MLCCVWVSFFCNCVCVVGWCCIWLVLLYLGLFVVLVLRCFGNLFLYFILVLICCWLFRLWFLRCCLWCWWLVLVLLFSVRLFGVGGVGGWLCCWLRMLWLMLIFMSVVWRWVLVGFLFIVVGWCFVMCSWRRVLLFFFVMMCCFLFWFVCLRIERNLRCEVRRLLICGDV